MNFVPYDIGGFISDRWLVLMAGTSCVSRAWGRKASAVPRLHSMYHVTLPERCFRAASARNMVTTYLNLMSSEIWRLCITCEELGIKSTVISRTRQWKWCETCEVESKVTSLDRGLNLSLTCDSDFIAGLLLATIAHAIARRNCKRCEFSGCAMSLRWASCIPEVKEKDDPTNMQQSSRILLLSKDEEEAGSSQCLHDWLNDWSNQWVTWSIDLVEQMVQRSLASLLFPIASQEAFRWLGAFQ